ncbi:MAG: hypothetical protein ACM3ZC_02790 [Bacteroidota bacterium]
MKTAFMIFDGMTALDFIGVYDPLTRLRTMGSRPEYSWEICAALTKVRSLPPGGLRPRWTWGCISAQRSAGKAAGEAIARPMDYRT